jgi:hypothetical protein
MITGYRPRSPDDPRRVRFEEQMEEPSEDRFDDPLEPVIDDDTE